MYWHVNRGGPQTHNAEWKEALCKIITVYIMIFTQYSRMGKTNGKISEHLLSLVGWSGVDWKKVMGQLSGMILLFSHSVVSKSLQLHGLQQARLPCPSLTPRVFLNSCQLSWWCYLTISSTATPFFFCLQSFPASGSFPLSQLLASGVQSTGASASASVLLTSIHGWYPLGLTGWIPLQSKELSRVFHNTTVQKHQFFSTQPSLWSNSHIQTWPLEKPTLILKHDYWLYLTIRPLSYTLMFCIIKWITYSL